MMHRKLRPQVLLLGLLCLAVGGLVVLVLRSPHRLIYDEPYFANYVPLLHEHGFTRNFLNSLTGTAGPLYAFVQAVFEPLTSLHPVGMRLVNVVLLLVVAGILVASSGHAELADRSATAGSLLVVPMTWVLGGMALSEMPALVFATLSLCLQLRGLQSVSERSPGIGWFLSSAICLGIAAWGRQPYLLLAGVLPVMAVADRRLRPAAVLFLCVPMVMVAPLFAIWGGLTPPSHHFVQQAPSPKNSLVALGYAGFAILLLAPGLAWRHRRLLVGLFVVAGIANTFLSIWTIYPLRSGVEHLLPGYAVSAYGTLCGSLAMTSSIATLAFVGHAIWKDRTNSRQLAINLGLLGLCLWPAFMGANFSSRYTAMALPYLLLAVEPLREWNLKTVGAAAVGCSAGAVALLGYYNQ